MMPAVPPFPTPWNFPFQPFRGSQTSKRIDGFADAISRQNAGRLASAVPPGGVNDGPFTTTADSMAVSGNGVLASAAHISGVMTSRGAAGSAPDAVKPAASARSSARPSPCVCKFIIVCSVKAESDGQAVSGVE